MQDHVKVIAVFIDEDRVKRAGPGENLRIRLSGVEEEDILSGFVLSSVGMDSLSLSLSQFKIFAGPQKIYCSNSAFYNSKTFLEWNFSRKVF